MKTLTLLINKENLNSGQISISVYQEGKDTHTHTDEENTQYWNVGTQ